jgi:hypothetical protein
MPKTKPPTEAQVNEVANRFSLEQLTLAREIKLAQIRLLQLQAAAEVECELMKILAKKLDALSPAAK